MSLIKIGKDKSGSVSLEFGLIAPVIAIAIVGILEVGLYAYEMTNLRSSARAIAMTVRASAPTKDGIQKLLSADSIWNGRFSVSTVVHRCVCKTGEWKPCPKTEVEASAFERSNFCKGQSIDRMIRVTFTNSNGFKYFDMLGLIETKPTYQISVPVGLY